MKIITENAAYVQKNDNNRYEFVKFEDKNEIEFFKNLDWMVDYNSVKDLNEEDFLNLEKIF